MAADPSGRENDAVANVMDVAAYLLQKQGSMTAMKLQKLVYYAQAWSLVWDQRPLFNEQIEAWANGPVCPDLYTRHRGAFILPQDWGCRVGGNPSKLDPVARETLDAVLSHYGDQHPQWLSDLTHMEAPWRRARAGLSDGERGSSEITAAAMAEYYGSLEPEHEVRHG